MSSTLLEDYSRAQRMAQKEYRQALSQGKDPYPAVLDTLLGDEQSLPVQEVGLVEVPLERIVGTKSQGRISAFSRSFLPLLEPGCEFANKWVSLLGSHLDEGIRDPILCYEYLGDFYVQEGNKRVSILRYVGAVSITANVKRLLPKKTEEPRIRAYYEFLDFYRNTKIYQVQFRRPGDYQLLLAKLGREPGEVWTKEESAQFRAYYRYFLDAFAQFRDSSGLRPEQALLSWLEVYPFRSLGSMSQRELKKTLESLWGEVKALASDEPVEVRTVPAGEKPATVLDRIIALTAEPLKVAFVHYLDLDTSTWATGHDLGRQQLEQNLGSRVKVRSYFHADDAEKAAAILDRAVADGANVVFTTSPQLSRPTLRAAVKYPGVRFLNCSVDTPYPSIRSYYSRVYEAKFVTGAIAGAMSKGDTIGYIGSSPILGVIASINAFALGAVMTNPKARIDLRWSCLPGTPLLDLQHEGIRVISNRDVPVKDQLHWSFCNYGTYTFDDEGNLQALASPVWLWGNFYEKVVRSILSGTWDKQKPAAKALNYWWGMDSGVIDVEFTKNLPDGVRTLAETLRQGLKSGTLDPFRRRIIAQDGAEKNDGSKSFSAEEILHMDWFCRNVHGEIPEFDEIVPHAQPMVRSLGVYKDRIPPEKEESV